MKKIIFTFFVLILSTACTQSGASGNDRIVEFRNGLEGLTIEFLKNAPPQIVFERSAFPVYLRIRNKGAGDVTSGILSIGTENDYITEIIYDGDDNRVTNRAEDLLLFSVAGKSQLNPYGDEVVVSLNAKTGSLEPQSEQKLSTLTGTLCYRYKTIASASVCIDPDVSGLSRNRKVCNVNAVSFQAGQGGPIAVTKIEPQILPSEVGIKPQFIISIENKGKGHSLRPDEFGSACGLNPVDRTSQTWNLALARVYSTGSQGEVPLECSPNIDILNLKFSEEERKNYDKDTAYIRFGRGQSFIRCNFKDIIPAGIDAYTSPLKIVIDYGYVQSIATNFVIQKQGKY